MCGLKTRGLRHSSVHCTAKSQQTPPKNLRPTGLEACKHHNIYRCQIIKSPAWLRRPPKSAKCLGITSAKQGAVRQTFTKRSKAKSNALPIAGLRHPLWGDSTRIQREALVRMIGFPLFIRAGAFPGLEGARRTTTAGPGFAGMRNPVLGDHFAGGRQRPLGLAGHRQRGDLGFLLGIETVAELGKYLDHLVEGFQRLGVFQLRFFLLKLAQLFQQLSPGGGGG